MSVRNVLNEELSVSKASNKKVGDIFLFLVFLYFLLLSFVQARAPILVPAGGGLISTATTADRFPITDKRYFRN